MDFFQSALQGKITPMYEYFLVGSVVDQLKDGFIEILRGLCDNSENRPIEFIENEFLYTCGTPQGSSVVTLRARLSQNEPHCHHLRYIGQTDNKTDKDKKAMVRTYIDCLTSPNLNDYLQSIGFNLDMELIAKGYLFHKGKLKVVVSKYYTRGTETQPPQPITQSHFVEISCVVPAGQDAVAEDVRRFADLLKPYVRMDKMSTLSEMNF